MDDFTPLSVPQDVYVPQKLKAFMSEPQGCALVSALEAQFQCSISVVDDALIVNAGTSGVPVDINQIDSILRDVWQKRNIQLMIREAALNASCTHMCWTILPRAYCTVVFFFSADFQRRSRCNDIIIEHFLGKVSIYGSEYTVNMARDLMIESLTEHFGPLAIEIPAARRTQRMGYNSSVGTFNSEVASQQQVAPSTYFSSNGMYPMGEPNAILSSTPPSPSPALEEAVLTTNFDNSLLFPAVPQQNFSVPHEPQTPPVVPHNVPKIVFWIPSDEVGKLLGNRSAMKKQIEGQFNCVITVNTDSQQFGMSSVEILAQSKDQGNSARDAIMNLMKSQQDVVSPTLNSPSIDSGFNSPTNINESPTVTPEKRETRLFRSSFRDQPKVMLALTPRKSSFQME